MTRVTRVGVVVPVHDEEALLRRCLDSVLISAGHVDDAEVEIVVVLDACTDDSAEIAVQYPVTIVRVDAACVGAARRAGVEALNIRPPLSTTWIACTDADSFVPPDWLTRQLELADAGHDVVLGAVRPDFVGLSERHIAYWHATHPPGAVLGNTHGANLGVRASSYDAVGGFGVLPEHEDVDLVARLRANRAAVIATAHTVTTSARREGRTPGGYAGHVRRVATELEGQPAG